MVVERKTGHMYYGSSMEPLEGSSNCGTCNGACCTGCRTYYMVEGESKHYDTKEAAVERDNALNNLVPTTEKTIDDPMFFVKDGELWCTVYIYSTGYADMLCNKDAVAYASVLEATSAKHTKYEECTCTDKAKTYDANPCCKYGCRDRMCFTQMKHFGRTTMKFD